MTQTAEEFVRHIAEEKPYLIEIENQILTAARGSSEAKLKMEVHIRGHNIVKVDFWNNTVWKIKN